MDKHPLQGLPAAVHVLSFLFAVVVVLLIATIAVRVHPPLSFFDSKTPAARSAAEGSGDTPGHLNITDGVHVDTGLLDGAGLRLVIRHCTGCHSAKIIIQNKADRAGWLAAIRWMQATQNLWELGDDEPLILDYLAKHYAPQKAGRRKNLSNIEWYELGE